MNIPLLDLKAQLDPIHDEIMAAIAATVDSTCYIMGPQIELFEKNVADYCGTTTAIGVSSGTDALLASLMALGVGRDDLVLTTPYSFFATMGSILRLGAQPVFADIDPVTYNIDPGKVAALLADAGLAAKIKAILPVHLFGQCAAMGPLLQMADEHHIPVVEDAAQAIGAVYPRQSDGGVQWQRAGSMGACGCFSFFPSKNLGGMGDGGMVVTNNDKLARDLKLIRVHGDISKYQHAVVGGNFRLDAMQAAILNVKLPYLPGWHAARRQNATLYNALFDVANPDGTLKVQMTAQVFFILEKAEDVLVAPASALQLGQTKGGENGAGGKNGGGRQGDGAGGQQKEKKSTVRVLSQDGSIEERKVTTGIRNQVAAEIRSGLLEGETVITGMAKVTKTGQNGNGLGGKRGGKL